MRRLVALVLAGLVVGACSSSGGDNAAPAPTTTTTTLAPVTIDAGELRARLRTLVRNGEAPGAVLGVQVRGGPPVMVAVGADPVSKQAFRPADPFRVASVTKTFVGALVLRLVQQGRLGLDDPVADFVPDWPRGDEITIRHLLTHTSGIPPMGGDAGTDLYADEMVQFTYREPAGRVTPRELLTFVRDRPLLFPPGTGTEYSNVNTILLGEVVARVTGASLGRQLHMELLDPLGLTATRYAAEEPAEYRNGLTIVGSETLIDTTVIDYTADTTARGAAFALVSNVPDLLAWGRAFLRDRTVVTGEIADDAFAIRPNGTGLGVIGFAAPRGFCLFGGCPRDAEFRGLGGPGSAPGAATMLVFDQPTDTVVAMVVARDGIPGLDEFVLDVLDLVADAEQRP